LHRYKYIKAQAGNWDIKFSKSALGDDEGAEIYYDEVDNRLIINDLPQDIVLQIQETLRERNTEYSDEPQTAN